MGMAIMEHLPPKGDSEMGPRQSWWYKEHAEVPSRRDRDRERGRDRSRGRGRGRGR